MEQLILHLIGDYILQTDYQALNKKKKSLKGIIACMIHCLTYSLPFLFITTLNNVWFIFLTHFFIDNTQIIAWFIAFKNAEKSIENFGFSDQKPFALSVWLYIIIDNTFHLICNYLIIKYL